MLRKQVLIICPGCKKRLVVSNLKNEPERRCKCRFCGQKIKVRFGKSVDNGGNDIHNDGDTILPLDTEAMKSCNIRYNDAFYQLSVGINRIGRNCKTCEADIKLDTDDGYMSRQHVIITVSSKPDGNLEAILRNDKNKNKTCVIADNGNVTEVEFCDSIVLHHGYHIRMANTEVEFQAVSGNDGDSTII